MSKEHWKQIKDREWERIDGRTVERVSLNGSWHIPYTLWGLYGTAEAAMQALDARDPLHSLENLISEEVIPFDDPPFRLIGLTGPARSGKDTVADILQEHGFARYALATPLKQGLRVMFNLTGEHTDGALKESPVPFLGGVTPRKLMQMLGTEWARHNIDDDVWLWLADEERQFVQGRGYPGMVITDVRFDNEAQFIRDRGGEVWHIRRPDVEAVSEHVSENGVSYRDEDSIIANTSTRSVLRDLVEAKL